MGKMLFGKTMEYYKEHCCNYTATEIHSQPRLWRETAKMMLNRKEEIEKFMDEVMAVGHLRIVTTGAGSSAFIGETMQYMLAKEMGIQMENIHTTDIISATDGVLFDVPTLLISYGRSGESPESVAAIRFAEKRIKILYHIVIVCDGESRLAKCVQGNDHSLVLVMPEGACDKGFAMTSSVSCMSLATWCLFHYKEIETYADYLYAFADDAEKELEEMAASAEVIADNNYHRIIWLGSGALKGVAREASIKSMELSDGYVHAGYDAPMGFRHGPKTVVNNDTITIHFLSNQDSSLRYDIDFVEEMIREKQENLIVTVGEERTRELISHEDYKITYSIPKEIPKDSEMGAYINCLLFAQLLSMKKSLQLGYTTDNPSQKGDVNRVVQGVVIYT